MRYFIVVRLRHAANLFISLTFIIFCDLYPRITLDDPSTCGDGLYGFNIVYKVALSTLRRYSNSAVSVPETRPIFNENRFDYKAVDKNLRSYKICFGQNIICFDQDKL